MSVEKGSVALTREQRLALATAINPDHLTVGAISKARAQLDLHENRHAVIDDFLLPALLPHVRELMAGSENFEANLKVAAKGEGVAHLSDAQRRSRVGRDVFEAVPDADRFISQEIYRSPGQEADTDTDTGRGARVDAHLRKVFRSPAMHAFLSALSGHELGETLPINLKRHGKDHFLRRHSDATGGRKLCGVIYLHEDWRPSYEGRFILYREDGSHFAIDPLPNRLVLFDVTVKNDHAIEELGNVPAGWWRSNYSIWFR